MKSLQQLHDRINKFAYHLELNNICIVEEDFDIYSSWVDDGGIEFAFYITGKDNLKISVHEEKISFQYSKFNNQHPSVAIIEKEFDKFFKGYPVRK